ncbi:hypothetical protein SAMN06265365_13847 [Tistlia consotensis]|uniref:Uncharacterized protein n=1 Tax=Tistlia consotensis USBA 355 TaxID=560819 RepID=A0A1Y6CNW2_9PROT|nr:hypothetical protein [Tistlia consotensis]SMF77550.1 hypothetical protein SAMN05428998_13716 [Tistlia consotensis USBA 355]SNS21172.1 hypothetical protein SAMN06265365_13847 [Tistlia consotensis]
MSQSYVIEIDDESVGLVVRAGDERRFVFHAASSRFGALDGARFATVRAAEKAAGALRRRPPLPSGRDPGRAAGGLR